MALMGTGNATGDNRAVEAAKKAISSRLLEEGSIQGARGVLINITGGPTFCCMKSARLRTLFMMPRIQKLT